MSLKKLLLYASIPFIIAGCEDKKSTTEPEVEPEPVVNHPPYIEEIVADPEVVFIEGVSQLECIAGDKDNDELNYDWEKDGEEGHFSDFNNERIIWHAPNQVGKYNISVWVSDGEKKALGNKSLEVISRWDTLGVSDDVWVYEAWPNWNSQNDENGVGILYVDRYEGDVGEESGYDCEVYSRFDVSSQERIRSAKIMLTLIPFEDAEDENYKPLFADLHELIGPELLDENTLNWVNRPNFDITPLQRFEIPKHLETPNTFYIEGENVTNLVRSWMVGPNYGFGIFSSQNSSPSERFWKVFYSKEGAQEEGNMNLAPALIIEYE